MVTKHCIKNFCKCGCYGWMMECLWTGCHSALSSNKKELTCKTSLWMFPIYGLAAFIEPAYHIVGKRNVLIRGSFYTACIFLTEYSTGSFLKKKGCCPWDYSEAKSNIDGIVRLDYAPVWFLVGLLYERSLVHPKRK